MIDHIPLSESATSRSPKLLAWLKSWSTKLGNPVKLLEPQGWFTRGHDWYGGKTNCEGMWMPSYKSGTFIWDPPPAAAKHAIIELRQARLKRQESAHIFVCPKLMALEWQRHLYKAADIVLSIPAGSEFWPAAMHESLTISIFFPFLSRSPWQLKGTRLLVDMERTLSKVWKDGSGAEGNLLCELCIRTRELETLPVRELCKVLLR